MDDLADLYDSAPTADVQTLETLANLAAEQLRLEHELFEMQEAVKEKGKELQDVSMRKIPELMNTLGVSKYVFTDGSELQLKDILTARISKANEPKAFEWLRENNAADIIKNEVSAKFPSGMDDEAEKMAEFLQSEGMPVEAKKSVHTGTLKSYIKEQISNGNDVPLELFSVWSGQEAKIKQAK